MHVRSKKNDKNETRFVGIEQLQQYLSVGRCTARKFADDAGATVHLGKRVLFDLNTIDRELNAMMDEENEVDA